MGKKGLYVNVQQRIGVVGLACKVPGAGSLEEFWDLVSGGKSTVGPLPPERFDAAIYHTCWGIDGKGELMGGLIEEPIFSGNQLLPIPPDQLNRMHPMEKVGLSVMHNALQDAGIGVRTELAANGRIYMAANTLGPSPHTDHGPRIRQGEFARLLEQALQLTHPDNAQSIAKDVKAYHDSRTPPIIPETMTTSASLAAGRIANLYDIQGGHIAVDAGVCSSLAAVEEAVRALRQHACDYALVVGVSPLVTASSLLDYWEDSTCVEQMPALGEGGVALVLMREDDIGERTVYGYIEGISSAMIANRNDEHEIVKATVIAATQALQQANVDPRNVSEINHRNSGFSFWGNAEKRALSLLYGSQNHGQMLPVSSAVPQIGFLQAASGMVEIARTLLSFAKGNQYGLTESGLIAVSDVGIAPTAYHALISRNSRIPSQSNTCNEAEAKREPIAIVGMGAIVPGANGRETFWKHTKLGYRSIGDLPSWKWSYEKVIGSNEHLSRISPSRLAGVVQLPELPLEKWGLTVEEASRLDFGVFLSVLSSWEAAEQAGLLSAQSEKGRVHVLMGQLPVREAEIAKNKLVFFTQYVKDVLRILAEKHVTTDVTSNILQELLQLYRTENQEHYDFQWASTGLTNSYYVAKALGIEGDILSVDAACASSHAAIELAIRRLHEDQADAVVVGGVAHHLVPEYNLTLQLLGALSSTGIPPFHQDADGFVPAEGAGAVVLKRLSDAKRDGNTIYTVISGIGTSSDGKGTSVLAPNSKGQRRAVERAMNQAGVGPDDIDHIEAHGTGTRVGDETEINTYQQIFGDRHSHSPYTIGAVKSQIGHLSSAAGIIGLIKTSLAIHEKMIPPSYIDERSALLLPNFHSEPIVWANRPERRRRAGVSAFGMGGINYFLVLEEPDKPGNASPARLNQPLPQLLHAQQSDRFTVELVPVTLPDRTPLFPMKGKRLLLLTDGANKWRYCQGALEAKGAVVFPLSPDVKMSEQILHGTIAGWEQSHGPISGIIDMRMLEERPELLDAPTDRFTRELEQVSDFTFMLLRYFYDRFEQAKPNTCCYIALISLGGNLGLTDCDEGNVLGAFLQGLLKSLKQELPALQAKTIDFPAFEQIEKVVSLMIQEVEDGNERMEVAYTDRRFVVHHKNANFTPLTPLARFIEKSDIYLFTGGGRGVVFECAAALARLGATVIVCGRTEVTEKNAPWLEMNEQEFAAFEREYLLKQRQQNPAFTIAQCKKNFGRFARERELYQNLKKAQELGIDYQLCDITDANQVHDLISRMVKKYGRIDGIIHGAMVEWSMSLPKKNKEVIDQTLKTKVMGLCHLLDATENIPLQSLICFGSGAGRFGNKGQADYSAANSLMSALLVAKCRKRKHPLHHVTLNWTAWESVGAAVSDPAITAILKQNGVPFTSPQEGIYWFLSELAFGREKESLIVREEFLQNWPSGGTKADGDGERRLSFQDRCTPVSLGEWPFIDKIMVQTPANVVIEREISMEKDLYLEQHCLDQIPIFPMVCFLEMLAEAAAVMSPGWILQEIQQFEVFQPCKLFHAKPVVLRAEAALTDAEPHQRKVYVRALSDVTVKGRIIEKDRLHAAACVVFGRAKNQAVTCTVPKINGMAYSSVLYHTHRETLQIGPLFCRASRYTMNEKEGVAVAAPPNPRKLFSFTSAPDFQVDPFLLDIALQIADSIDTFHSTEVSLPISIGKISFGRRRKTEEHVTVYGKMIHQEGTDMRFHIRVAGENGDLIIEIEDFLARRIAR